MFQGLRLRMLLIALPILLAGCSGSTGSTSAADTRPRIVASFYPLQWVAQQVAGENATVTSLTKAGAEPHDLELTPQDVASLADAALVIYLSGFQPAVDDAAGQEAGDRSYDVSAAANLNLTYTPIEEGEEHADEAGATDPHFWLDPVRLAAVGDALAARLGEFDPKHKNDYLSNAAALRDKLEVLDKELASGLRACSNRTLVTSHNSFGYLAQRYGLTQIGITGLTPEAEPKPADLAAAAAFVRKHDVRTIYYETLVSPAVARTVAGETGAQTGILDPIEGLTAQSQGSDYLQIMRSNLANIRKGQPCP